MRFAVLFALTLSTSALACPDLTGTYARCQSDLENSENNTTDLVVKQSVQDGITSYEMTETWTHNGERETAAFPADGQTHIGEESPDGLPISTNLTISCRDDEAVVAEAEILMQGNAIGFVNSEFFKRGNQLIKKVEGEFLGQAVSEEVVCE